MNFRNLLRHLDWPLLIATLILVGISLLVLQSITLNDASAAQGFTPNKQILFAVIGLILMAVFTRVDYHLWQRVAPFWYGLGLFALILVYFFGTHVQGAARWINLGPLQFQPAEFIKLGLIMLLAKLFTERYEELPRARYLLLSILYVVVPAILILVQPDLGSTLVLGFIWGVLIIASNVNKLYLAGIILAVVALSPFVVSHLKPYQVERIESFANPLSDPQGSGYNVLQSTIAVGSGRWFGRGLSSGSQSQLNFLPSQQTDFIFATLAEKLGFVGALLVLLLFAALLLRAIVIAWRANDRFGMLLALGISGMFLFHIVINIGMNLGIMPVTGIPLPLVSYGGTSLIVSLISIGILESIAIYRNQLEFSG